jgi:hypothetical protein
MITAKKKSVCHVPPPYGEICATLTASPLRARELKIFGKLQLGQLDACHFYNFEILKFLE